MEITTITPNKAKKPRALADKTVVGRPTPAANEAMPLVTWSLPMQVILHKLENLAMAAHEIDDLENGADIYASRIDMAASRHFKVIRLEVEQGKHDVESIVEALYDGQALIVGAKALDTASPNRQALHELILKCIDDTVNTHGREGLDDSELTLIAAQLPSPNDVQKVCRQPQQQANAHATSAAPKKVSLASSLLTSGDVGRSLLLRASFDIEALGMNLVKQVVDLGLDHEESCMLRTMAIRICELNSPIMSFLSDDEGPTVGDVHFRLNHGALGLPEGVVTA